MGSEAAAGAALLDWIKLFPIDSDISDISELNSGTIICKILLDIDHDAFSEDLSKISNSSQWVVRFQNLKKIYKALTHYYTNNLGLTTPTSSKYAPDLLAIAREASRPELVKLVKMALIVAVQSERRQHYINKIQELSPTSQTELMKIINSMMTLNDQDATEDSADKFAAQSSETEFQMEEEIGKLVAEKDALEAEHKKLLERFNKSQVTNEDLRSEIQILQDRITEKTTGGAAQSARVDTVLQIQLDKLQADVHKLEDTVTERDNTIASHENTIKQLTRKLEDFGKTSDEVEGLKDELDASKHTIEKLRKEQNVMIHYKKKVETMAELEKKVKYLEDENLTLQKENRQMEEVMRQNTGEKKLAGTYKKQIERFETDHSELLKEKQRLDLENATMKEKLLGAESQRTKDTELIQNLEFKIGELENGLMGQVSESIQGDLASEMTFKGVTKTDLKLQINKLERENQALKESGSKGVDNVVLQSLLDDKEKAQSRLEQDILSVNGDKLALEAELATLRAGGTFDENSDFVQQLRKNIEERDKIIQETRKQLDDRPTGLVGSNDASLNKVLLEKSELQTQLAELKDSLLDAEKSNGELKASLATIGGSSEGRQGELEKRVLQLQDKLEDRRESLLKSREHIKKQNSTIKELQEEIESLKVAARNQGSSRHDEEFEEQEEKIKILRRELDLMTSAWYDMSTRLQSNTVALGRRKDAPVSWLGKQRQAIANFPRR